MDRRDARRLRRYLHSSAPFVAGTANVVMQLGIPAVGHALVETRVESGDVRKHPVKRLRTTVSYLAVAMLGTDAERETYRYAVNGQHRQVRSTPDSPVSYNAFRRDLQLWVAACLAFGAFDVHERLVGPVAEPEWFYAQTERLATSLQVSADSWPADRAAFDAYFSAGLEALEYDDTVRDYLLDLLYLRQLPPWQRLPLARWHRRMNVGFLPPIVREKMRLEWSVRDQRRFDRDLRALAFIGRLTPGRMRSIVFDAVLADLRGRIRRGLPLV